MQLDIARPPASIISTPTGDIDVSRLAAMPSRIFRDAWRLSGDIISIDLDAAKEIHKARLRVARAAAFNTVDRDRAVAIENGDQTKLANVKKRADALRDVTKDAALVNATTPEQIEAYWPADLLGER